MDSSKNAVINKFSLGNETEITQKEVISNRNENKQTVLPNLNRQIPELISDEKFIDEVDFCKIRQLTHYVDKTMFINNAINFSNIDANIICGPRNRGKSTNLSMLYYFFAIYQKKPSPIVNIEDNPYKVLFENTQIANHPEIIKNYFGQYPVIYLKFGNITATTHDDIYSQLLKIVYDIIGEYRYLLEDKKTRKSLIEILMGQSDIKLDPAMYLVELCVELNNYYRRAPIILIDDFDYPLTNVLEKSQSRNEKEKIFKLFGEFYKPLLKDNRWLEKSILTGISRLVIQEAFNPWVNYTVRNLIDGKFIESYSFQQEEIDQLLNNLEFVPQKNDIKQRFAEEYSGYKLPKDIIDKEKKIKYSKYFDIYNPSSVSSALNIMQRKYEKYGKRIDKYTEKDFDEIFGIHWFDSTAINFIQKVFSAFNFHLILKKLLREEPVYSNLVQIKSTHIFGDELMDIYDITVQKYYVEEYCNAETMEDLVLTILVSIGYLTFDKAEIKVPAIQLHEGYDTIKELDNEEDRNATLTPNQQKVDKGNTKIEGSKIQYDNYRENYAYKVSIPNNELRRGLQMIDDRLMEKVYVNHTNCFRESTNAMRELLFVNSNNYINSTLRQIFECFCILTTREKNITDKNMAETKEGIIFSEKTMQLYLEGAIPRGDNIRIGSDVIRQK